MLGSVNGDWWPLVDSKRSSLANAHQNTIFGSIRMMDLYLARRISLLPGSHRLLNSLNLPPPSQNFAACAEFCLLSFSLDRSSHQHKARLWYVLGKASWPLPWLFLQSQGLITNQNWLSAILLTLLSISSRCSDPSEPRPSSITTVCLGFF